MATYSEYSDSGMLGMLHALVASGLISPAERTATIAQESTKPSVDSLLASLASPREVAVSTPPEGSKITPEPFEPFQGRI